MNLLESAARIQVTYGAVLLSFLGALHWGMEFAGYNGHKGMYYDDIVYSFNVSHLFGAGYPRLLLGAAPVLYAWPTLALPAEMAIVAQWAGFTGLVGAESMQS